MLLSGEEPLQLDEIQGHVLIGFGSAPQALGAFTAREPMAAARTVGRWAGRVTPARHLLARKGQRARDVIGRIRSGPWVTVAVSHRVLDAAGVPSRFDDDWFELGDMAEAVLINDAPPADGRSLGSDWDVGAPGRPVDVLLVVAAGTAGAAEEVVGWFAEDARDWLEGEPFVERLLPMKGSKEHFGFRDGISQPAILGTVDGEPFEPDRARDDGGSTLRTTAAQDLMWPGEFVFGYCGTQDGDPRAPGPEARPADDAAAAFARNGSMLVYRRLAQDVPEFRAFARHQARAHAPEGDRLTAERVESLLVGRRRDGLPLSAPEGADTRDPLTMNAFTFRHDQMDDECPFAAHIRKVNPRLGDKDKRVRRLLRRGAPFGRPYEEEEDPPLRGRGLAFLAYQTNTEAQFGMLQTHWMNDPARPSSTDAGHDLIVGQAEPGQSRFFRLSEGPPPVEIVDEGRSWVRMTGGAFLFTPSMSALRALAEQPVQGTEVQAMVGPEPEDLEGALKQHAIYEHPDDFPEGYVVREWLVAKTGEVLPGDGRRAATLEEARALLPEGATQVSGRDPDEPKIIEVWM